MRFFALGFALFLVAAAAFYAPHASNELGSLIPVETLCVDSAAGMLRVRGEDVEGHGATWAAAMDDLIATADGKVFLETAERIVLSETCAEAVLPQLLEDTRIRPSAQLFVLRGKFSDAFYGFIAAQESVVSVGTPGSLPLILEEAGRYRLA